MLKNQKGRKVTLKLAKALNKLQSNPIQSKHYQEKRQEGESNRVLEEEVEEEEEERDKLHLVKGDMKVGAHQHRHQSFTAASVMR